ncbi:MAG: type II toxin-antitoxin system RelE/ParE family toxin [Agathobacter sp.]|nr:type II toxin-antitoxin system RelE/ParE family toxin [Agathobacter sp.]
MAEEDIVSQTDYIAFELNAPETAIRIARGLKKTINNLSVFPYKHELDEDEELACYNIRKTYYKNYKIFFVIDEQVQTVFILGVYHMLEDSKKRMLRGYTDGRKHFARGISLYTDGSLC